MSTVVICSSVVSSVCAAVPLSDVFSSDCGKVVATKYLKAIANDVGDKWVELADELDTNTDEIPHKRPGNLPCRRMLENWVEKNGDNAMICVLSDALYACGLQHVADRHFGHIVDTVLRKQTNTELSTELAPSSTHGGNNVWFIFCMLISTATNMTSRTVLHV